MGLRQHYPVLLPDDALKASLCMKIYSFSLRFVIIQIVPMEMEHLFED